jgi:ABC-2 type transport system permease protein
VRRDLWPSPALISDTVRAHRTGMLAWVVGGTVVMVGMSMALAGEMASFPGGPQALADSVMPGAIAMRPMRWPAERLDTLGGYLTYHNITLVWFFLAVYGAVQGARAIRGGEERHSLEEVLATGWSRASVVRDRVLGFLAAVAVIVVGLGLGIAWAMAAGGQPNLAGSLVTTAACGMCAVTGFALALAVSQVTRTARVAAGASVLVLTGLYVATNVWEDLGPFGAIRFVSPFHYASASRALVPGHGLDLGAMAAMTVMADAMVALAIVAFQRRDYGSPLWTRRRNAPAGPSRRVRVQRWWLRTIWRERLTRGWSGIAVWALATAAFCALFVALLPTVMDAWAAFDFLFGMVGGLGTSPETAYLAFCFEVVAPVIAAYVVTQASAWVTDLEQGRVETILSAPASWTRLVLERGLAVVIGVLAIATAAGLSVAVTATRVGAQLDAPALVRLLAMLVLLGAALTALAAVVVAWTRSTAAVVVLALYLGGAYLLTVLVPLFGWPTWINRLSIFDAFGHPYLEAPSTVGLVILLACTLLGSMLAAAVAERTPKVA